MWMSDASQVVAFASKLKLAPSKKRVKVLATTKKAAVNIKKSVQADLRGSSNPGIRSIPIEFDEPFLSAPMQVTVEIGPSVKAGGLANIAFGSSPRVRGKRLRPEIRQHARRIIPASAGQTPKSKTSYSTRSDHPRECGANIAKGSTPEHKTGSSPRVRGKLS